jgi:hypothetical protein
MSRLVFVILLISGCVLGLLAGCGGPSIINEETAPRFKAIVAEFDPGYSLSASQLYDKMFRSTIYRIGGVVDDSTKRDFLDSILVDTLAGLEADSFDLESRWGQYRVFRDQAYVEIVKRYWDQAVTQAVTIDSQEARQFYEDHPEIFKVREQVDLYHILCSPVGIHLGPDSLVARNYSQYELWDAAEEYCNNLHRLLDFGADIQSVARQYSQDRLSQRNGGHVGWTGRGTYLDPFDSVAFSLNAGQYSDPYRDEQGWHIIYVDGKYDSGAVPIDSPGMFDAIWETTATVKQNARVAALMDSLKAGLKLEYNEPLMSVPLTELEDSAWLGIVNGIDTVDVRLIRGSEELVPQEYEATMTRAEIRKKVVDRAAERFVLVQAARATGIDTLPEVREAVQALRCRNAKNVLLMEYYGQEFEPTDSMIREYYNAHIEDYRPSKPVSVQMVTVKDSLQAEFLLAQAGSGFTLPELPERFSKELGTKIVYEDIGPIGADYDAPDIYRKALATLPGNLRLAVSNRGYHVLTVSKNAIAQSVEMARGGIVIEFQTLHRREQFLALRDRLYAKYSVRFPNPMPAVKLPRLGDRYALLKKQ